MRENQFLDLTKQGTEVRSSFGGDLTQAQRAWPRCGFNPRTREIPAGQTLLDRLELDGTVGLMDALHTQVQTAHTIVQEGGGHFVVSVKGNQGSLLDQAKHFLPEDFPSSALASRARPRPN